MLFAGTILPVHLMARAGTVLSILMPSRWAFAAVGHDLGARHIRPHHDSHLGPPPLASFGNGGTSSTGTYRLVLATFSVGFLVATSGVLVRGTRGWDR